MVNGLVKGEGFAVDASAMEANANRYRGKAPDELDWTNAQRQKRAVAEYLAALEAEAGSQDETERGDGDGSDGGRERLTSSIAASPWRSARAFNLRRSDSGGHHVGRCRIALLPSRGHPGTWPNPRGR
jgi:hypothetical protein